MTQNSKRNTVAQVTPHNGKFTACNVQYLVILSSAEVPSTPE